MQRDGSVAGVVLAGGASRRFGSPKQLAMLDGRPLLAHAVGTLRAAAGLDRRIVVLGAEADAIRREVDLSEVLVVRCEDWAAGISSSLRAGIDAAAETSAAVMWFGDQPAITLAAVSRLVSARDPARAVVVRAAYRGRPGHPVLFERAVFPELMRLKGDEGARAVVEAHGWEAVECADVADDADIDTAAALRKADCIHQSSCKSAYFEDRT